MNIDRGSLKRYDNFNKKMDLSRLNGEKRFM